MFTGTVSSHIIESENRKRQSFAFFLYFSHKNWCVLLKYFFSRAIYGFHKNEIFYLINQLLAKFHHKTTRRSRHFLFANKLVITVCTQKISNIKFVTSQFERQWLKCIFYYFFFPTLITKFFDNEPCMDNNCIVSIRWNSNCIVICVAHCQPIEMAAIF